MRLTIVALAIAAYLFSPPNVSAQMYSGEVSCPLFPSNNIWSAAIDKLPVHPRSTHYIT